MINVRIRPYDKTPYQQLVASGITPLMARLYAARGITSSDQMDCSFAALLPFSQLKNCETMAARLADAIQNHQRLMLIADYDADGATACAVAMEGLSKMGARVEFMVPNRFKYGYGLTAQIVECAAQKNPNIIITLDNGISSFEGVARAHELGIEVFITDHHLPSDELPNALIVNPNQPECLFPSKYLAGVGVIFYVLLALRAELRARGAFSNQPIPNMAELLDWVAIGTISDVAQLDQNNRILVEQGLRHIRSGRCHTGTKALFAVAKKAIHFASAFDLSYAIGPRLNAAGRMDDMTTGIACLLEQNAMHASKLAEQLEQLNSERRAVEAAMQNDALKAVSLNTAYRCTLTLYNQNWHLGVVGILASRLKDRFYRPTVVFALSEQGELCGSARSIAGFNIRHALDVVNQRQPGLLNRFGGHDMAAGLSIAPEDLTDFADLFEHVAKEQLNEALLTRYYDTDGHLDNKEMLFNVAKQLEQQVWGRGFEAPFFYDCFTVDSQQLVADKHLKLILKKHAETFEGMLFHATHPLPDCINAVYQLMPNTWRNQESVQLYIKHWAVPDLSSR